MAKRRIFAFGTLLPGFGNHRVMQRAGGTFVTDAMLSGYEMFSFGAFPGIRLNPEERVFGQVWEVEDIQPLDWLEGHPSFYLRTPVLVDTPDGGEAVETYVPTGNNNSYKKVEGGRWL